MNEKQKNIIEYIVACVAEFAKSHKLDNTDAYNYLQKYKGIAFLEESYDVEHTFSIDDTVNHLAIVCKNNGGTY